MKFDITVNERGICVFNLYKEIPNIFHELYRYELIKQDDVIFDFVYN